MSKLSYLASIFILFTALVSCNENENSDPGTFTLSVNAKAGADDMVLNNVYTDVNGYRFEPVLLKFYVSNLTLIKSDGTNELVQDIALLDWQNNQAGEPETISVEVDPGTYSGIRFWLGVDAERNDKGSVTYPQDHPLSVFRGTYWTWNTGYRFIMFEGYFDDVTNGTGSISRSNSFVYHTGTDTLYMEADLTNAQQPFSIESDKNFTYSLNLDIKRMWYSANDTIMVKDNPSSHTTSNFTLAERVTLNATQAFSLD